MSLKNKLGYAAQKIVKKMMNMDVSQEENKARGEKKAFGNMSEILRKCAEEGTVLLRNNNNILPLNKNEKICIFGRNQIDYFYVGYGSGGDVKAPYYSNPIEVMIDNGANINLDLYATYKNFALKKPLDHGFWGNWPMNAEEMDIDEETAKSYSNSSDKAVIFIGRAAGEDRENLLTKGSYYLTDKELKMINFVTNNFKQTCIIFNCGNIIDFSFLIDLENKVDSIVLAYQGGMESGNALYNILYGYTNPSGKLVDTIAKSYDLYPSAKNFQNTEYNEYVEDIFVGYRYFNTFKKDDILFPFGFGLSYTKFSIKHISTNEAQNGYDFTFSVTNEGNVCGKETVMCFVSKPSTILLSNPKVELIAYKKTKELEPFESEIVSMHINIEDLVCYDTTRIIDEKYPKVLLQGEYNFYFGNNSVDLCKFFCFNQKEEKVFTYVKVICPLNYDIKIIGRNDKDDIIWKDEKGLKIDLKNRILDSLPSNANKFEIQKEEYLTFNDVKEGKISLDEFINNLSSKELEALGRGHGMMNSSYGVNGNAGAYGGIIEELNKRGVNAMVCTDGPAGIRISYYTSLLPNGTMLASMFNPDLIYLLGEELGKELVYRNVSCLLAPGMNIHRNVLCGRNFEYYSEDPFVSGKTAAAMIKGIQSQNVAACPKHFACNNQETGRTVNDSRLSQRALREIYLRGFEIAVKEGKPLDLMTSYNMINGIYSYYNYDLIKTVLRNEWKFEGVVITDWWMKIRKSPEFKNVKGNAYRIRSGVNVLMPGGATHFESKYKSDGTTLKNLNEEEALTLYELKENAYYVLRNILLIEKGQYEKEISN